MDHDGDLHHGFGRIMKDHVKLQDEDAIEFANRVKKEIARKGGLVDLVWDGNLKRQGVRGRRRRRRRRRLSRMGFRSQRYFHSPLSGEE